MSGLTWTQRLYWRYFSKPVQERGLFQHLIHHGVGSVLELGIGDGSRLRQLLGLYRLREGATQLRYAGVDRFESAQDQRPHLRLKDVHRLLAEHQVKAHLIPGDTAMALPRLAHTVLPSDLIIIDSGWQDGSETALALEQWMPRLVHEHSCVFARPESKAPFQLVALPAPIALRQAA